MGKNAYPEKPWDHPDWYDLHDREWTAGSEREPEHYHEFIVALPPLDSEDHLLDIGAGTGKLSVLIANAYPRLGLITLAEPNDDKLQRARLRLKDALGSDRLKTLNTPFGKGQPISLSQPASIAIVGSVLMPILEDWSGTPESAMEWLRQTLAQVRDALRPGGWFYALETTARFWTPSGERSQNRRLTLLELQSEFERAGFQSVECVYRFRDRVIVRGSRE